MTVIEEEREILTEEKVVLDIRMKRNVEGFLRTAALFLLWGPVGGVIADDHERERLQKRISSIRDASEGDIDMLIMAPGVKGKLILTSNNFVFLFQRGFRKKVDTFVAIPLQLAKSVEKASWFGVQKFLLMKFEVAGEKKQLRFDLRVFVKNKEEWLTELTRRIRSFAA